MGRWGQAPGSIYGFIHLGEARSDLWWEKAKENLPQGHYQAKMGIRQMILPLSA